MLKVSADDSVRRFKRVSSHPNDPLRQAELRFHRTQGFDSAFTPPIEIPPAASVRNEMQFARRRPFRLKDRFVDAASDANLIGHRAVLLNLGHPKFGAVPGHIRMVPLKPCQTRTFRIQPRRGIEIGAAGERALRARSGQRYPDDCVGRFATWRRMILAHADHSPAFAINHAVGVAHFDFRRDRLRRPGAVDAIQALVTEVRKIRRAAAYRITAAAVFVDTRAGVEWMRRDVYRSPIRREFDNHVAAFLLRPGLYPVYVFAVNLDLPQPYRAGNDQIGSDRRFPGTVVRYLRFRHICSSSKGYGKLAVCLVFPKDHVEGVEANILGAHPGSVSWERRHPCLLGSRQ